MNTLDEAQQAIFVFSHNVILSESIICDSDVIHRVESVLNQISGCCNEDDIVDQVLPAKEVTPSEALTGERGIVCHSCCEVVTGAHHYLLYQNVVHRICGLTDGSLGKTGNEL